MSLLGAWRESVNRFPEKPALIFGDLSWTYAHLDRLTTDLSGHLSAAGLHAGDRLALHLPNIPELALGYLGCLKAGVIAVPVNPRLKEREIDYILRHSEAVGYVGHQDFYPEVAALRTNLPGLRFFCLAGPGRASIGCREL